jgi:hypothetical protein
MKHGGSQLTTTIETYVTAGMMQVYPSARMLLAIPRQLECGTAVHTGIGCYYRYYAAVQHGSPSAGREPYFDLSVVQAAVDANRQLTSVWSEWLLPPVLLWLHDFIVVLTGDA